MPQIADWLQKLGFGQYAQIFIENEIDISVTDQNLKEIGIPLGSRRKILAGISRDANAAQLILPMLRKYTTPFLRISSWEW